MLKKKIIPLLLVLVLLISFAQPASAASITGQVEPSGVYNLAYADKAYELLPDRTRVTYTYTPDVLGFFAYDSQTGLTYDSNTTRYCFSGSSSNVYEGKIYLSRNQFLKLPVAVSSTSGADFAFGFSGSFIIYDSHSTSFYPTFTYCVDFYDSQFNYIDSSKHSATFNSSATAKTFVNWPLFFPSASIPDDTAYFVPYLSFDYSKSSTKNRFIYVYPDLSVTFRCDVLDFDEFIIDGKWTFNNTISWPTSLTQDVNFTCGSYYTSMAFTSAENDYTANSLVYGDPYGSFERVYADSWPIASKNTVDFGHTDQTVSAEFYAFLTANATRVGDSTHPYYGGTVTIKDYSGSSTLDTVEVDEFPCIVTVTETGLEFRYTEDGDPFGTYTYSGTGTFIGASSAPSSSGTTFTIGTSFSLFGAGDIFIHAEGDTGESGSDTGTVYVYDSSGSVVCDYFTGVEFPCTVTVTETGLELVHPGTSGSLAYTYTGTGDYQGASPVPDATSVLFPIGTSFILYGPGKIYIQDTASSSGGSGDSSGSGSGDSSGGSDSTDTTDPTTDPLEDEKNQANIGGNSSVNDLLEVVPDYSEGFVTALEGFADAFSYEGTACALTIPGITIPAVSDLIPKFELYPKSVVNVESLFSLFPENIILLVQSLLTIGLIGYCFKELYEAVSYILTLRKGDS